jgi:hypothetical protein
LRELTASGVMTDSSWCTASADVDENGDAKVKSQMERRYSLRGRLLTNNDTVIMHYTPMIDRRVIFNSIVLQTTASAEWRTGWRWLGRGRAIAFDVTWCLREEPRHLAIRRRDVGVRTRKIRMRDTAQCLIHQLQCLNCTFYPSIASIDQYQLNSNFWCQILEKEYPLLSEKEDKGNIEEESGTNRD